MIEIKTEEDIKKMRAAGKIVAEVHRAMYELVKPGISTLELDKEAEKIIRAHGALPAFLGYNGFRGTLCTSVNEEVVHGIPQKGKILKDGDIISIDVGARLDGFYSDAAVTIGVGKVSDDAQRLIDATKKSLELAIGRVKPGVHLGDVSNAVETFAMLNNLGIVREYCGHGVGRNLHEEPNIPNYGMKGTGPVLKKGYVLAIEPMLNAGTDDVKTLRDGWTVVTKDGSLSAHFEHTVAVTEDGCEILTI
ncbi:methionyl aminopeptidase [Elusimicrobium simillimum]|uniref:type I methionyl aminopeptidase n=1 Tax=Elusimicrobium simillimum TaxID=3143438 RepID=UPI003C7036A7